MSRERTGWKTISLWAIAAAIVLLTANGGFAAPASELWPRWLGHDSNSRAVVDHKPWDKFLKAYVVTGKDGVNRLPYGRIKESDRRALSAYIDALSATPVSRHNRDEQRALWINLYNAVTVRLMLDHYPLDSILNLNISPGLFTFGPWGRKLVSVEGEALSLDDIEHRILRPIWRDPRIHYAVNCASIGCPNLQAKAFTGANADRLLTAAARAYVNNWRGADFGDGELNVSSLYKWYRDDFGGSVRGVLAHLRRYAGPALARRLRDVANIGGYRYDWALNDAPPSL